MEQSIQDFINCKRISVVGCSSKGRKFDNSAYKELKQRGYQVLPVYPKFPQFYCVSFKIQHS
ncbi:MAG: CoA-binding protein [Ignavibacteriaceae bacterium]